MNRKLKKFYDFVEDMDTAMFTTRRRDGHLVSRPMANQKRASGADLWFVTYTKADKIREISKDPHVNLAYYKDRTREWISVSGIAKIVDNRKKIHELYAPDWRVWFGDEGGDMDGSPDDPRMVLIGVDIHTAMYMEVNKPQPVVLFEVLTSMVTGKTPNIGDVKEISGGEARRARSSATKGASKKRTASKPSSKKGR
ncbi:MAG TPA: pyridoxamine 5'-phosphate oxidase family protein [Thermoanaerobaculia bacterium]|nr:pyridoxamine 5'-phosphate oxidase family protein [Thermoanaerobaculia bacterium]